MSDLKDVILSTIAEIEDISKTTKDDDKENRGKVELEKSKKSVVNIQKNEKKDDVYIEDEKIFLNSLRERLLVLFEGFQAPNNSNLEAKIDLTLNFLEYVLATIDDRLDEIKKRDGIGKV